MSQIESDDEEIEIICVQKIAVRVRAQALRARASMARDGRFCGASRRKGLVVMAAVSGDSSAAD
jgi:hypothetical protein